jgi:hypothetical protein
MYTWRGWTTTTAAVVNTPPTWDEWRAAQRRLLGSEQRRQLPQRASYPFTARELARLSFVRWLHHTGRLAPIHNDQAPCATSEAR